MHLPQERLDVAIARSAAAPASDDPSKRKKLKTSFTISERFALLAAFAQVGRLFGWACARPVGAGLLGVEVVERPSL